jgi:tripartite-type tricarboxylate transporter receptor subunit TctC
MMVIHRLIWAITVCVALLVGTGSLSAQDYPNRIIRIIVVYPPGGGLDLVMRALATKLSEYWGRPIVIDNRGGAATTIGATMAAKAPADGYTLLSTDVSFSITATLFKNLQYDPIKDFVPISLVNGVSNVMVVHPSVPAKTVKELVTYMHKSPTKLMYATGGSGTLPNLAMVIFMREAGVEMEQISYRGSGGSMLSMVAGTEQVYIGALGTVAPYITSGQLRPIAVLDQHRSKLLPDVPTIVEAGLPNAEARSWYGLLAPVGTDRAIVSKIAAGVKRALREPDVLKVLDALGDDPIGTDPDTFAEFLKSDLKKWGDAVQAAGATVD